MLAVRAIEQNPQILSESRKPEHFKKSVVYFFWRPTFGVANFAQFGLQTDVKIFSQKSIFSFRNALLSLNRNEKLFSVTFFVTATV